MVCCLHYISLHLYDSVICCLLYRLTVIFPAPLFFPNITRYCRPLSFLIKDCSFYTIFLFGIFVAFYQKIFFFASDMNLLLLLAHTYPSCSSFNVKITLRENTFCLFLDFTVIVIFKQLCL